MSTMQRHESFSKLQKFHATKFLHFIISEFHMRVLYTAWSVISALMSILWKLAHTLFHEIATFPNGCFFPCYGS